MVAEEKYSLSIAIVTRNRPDSLKKTLQSLSDQLIKPFEVIISDDSNIAEMVTQNCKLAGTYNCRYISGPQNGLYSNRNFVAKHCLGTHFRTMDDDHEFPVGHLEACIQAITSEPETIWTIGEFNPGHPPSAKPYPVPGQLYARGFATRPNSMDNYYGISCGATIYPQSVIKKNILNFDKYKFGLVYLEYGARLKHLGYTLKVLESTYIIHDDTRTTASEMAKSITAEARIFSMMCLSFLYQKSTKNKVLTFFEVCKIIVRSPGNIKIVHDAYRNYKYISAIVLK